MNPRHVAVRWDASIEDIEQIRAQGDIPICSRCRAELEIALDPAEVQQLKIPAGVRCPRDPRHFQIAVCFKHG
jgi:hypothetical protein